MSTPKKRLDSTIVNLAARIETSPEARASGSHSPSRRTTTKHIKESSGTPTRTKTKSLASGAIHSPVTTTPNKHTKASFVTPSRTKMKISAGDGSQSPRTTPSKHSKISTGTPTRTKDKVQPCEKGQDLYNRICKGLIDSSRTPSKNNNKVVTPSKFFKSRTPAAHGQVIKRVSVSICDEPQDYITDVENMKRGRSKRTRLVRVETVMPLYNIETGIDGQDDVEIVADIVEELVEKITSGLLVTEKRSSRKTIIRSKNKAKRDVQEGWKDDFSSLQMEDNEEDEQMPRPRSRKRKGSTQESQPSKKRNIVVYNSADSSDDDDAMFISTMKPILSEDDKKEMDEVLGVCNASDKPINETEYDVSKEIIDGKKRKEGAQ